MTVQLSWLEHYPYKIEVTGSSPVMVIMDKNKVQRTMKAVGEMMDEMVDYMDSYYCGVQLEIWEKYEKIILEILEEN